MITFALVVSQVQRHFPAAPVESARIIKVFVCILACLLTYNSGKIDQLKQKVKVKLVWGILGLAVRDKRLWPRRRADHVAGKQM